MTVIEFAILGPIFFVLIAAIMETALVFFATQTLDSAVNNSTRIVRTGQAQGMSADGYRAEICSGLYGMFNCDELRIVLRPITEFGAYSDNTPVNSSGDWAVSSSYNPGTGNSVMAVEAYYKFPAIFAIPQLTFGLLPDHTRLLATARVFMNEPFA